jgi:hypothetical protein
MHSDQNILNKKNVIILRDFGNPKPKDDRNAEGRLVIPHYRDVDAYLPSRGLTPSPPIPSLTSSRSASGSPGYPRTPGSNNHIVLPTGLDAYHTNQAQVLPTAHQVSEQPQLNNSALSSVTSPQPRSSPNPTQHHATSPQPAHASVRVTEYPLQTPNESIVQPVNPGNDVQATHEMAHGQHVSAPIIPESQTSAAAEDPTGFLSDLTYFELSGIWPGPENFESHPMNDALSASQEFSNNNSTAQAPNRPQPDGENTFQPLENIFDMNAYSGHQA